jgi:hypothetical protein
VPLQSLLRGPSLRHSYQLVLKRGKRNSYLRRATSVRVLHITEQHVRAASKTLVSEYLCLQLAVTCQYRILQGFVTPILTVSSACKFWYEGTSYIVNSLPGEQQCNRPVANAPSQTAGKADWDCCTVTHLCKCASRASNHGYSRYVCPQRLCSPACKALPSSYWGADECA